MAWTYGPGHTVFRQIGVWRAASQGPQALEGGAAAKSAPAVHQFHPVKGEAARRFFGPDDFRPVVADGAFGQQACPQTLPRCCFSRRSVSVHHGA